MLPHKIVTAREIVSETKRALPVNSGLIGKGKDEDL